MDTSVLVIDDDPIQLRLIELLNRQHNIFTLSKCYEEASLALNDILFNKQEYTALPDFILLDLNMPGLNGWEFLSKYGEIAPTLAKQIRIIVITSSVNEKDKLFCNQFSFVRGFYSKPITASSLQNIFSSNLN